jgi:DNA-binding NarL/FixJ family response regulator
MKADRPRVLVVEDDANLAAAIGLVLGGAGITALETTATAREAEARVRSAAPDLLLVDLGLPDRDGVELIRALRASGVGAPVLVLTSATGADRILAALRAGADGYLFKEDLDGKLAASVRELAAGGTPLSHAAARVVVDDLRRRSVAPSSDVRPPSLTPRESAVLELLSTGASYAEIGRDLGIEINTVRTHIRSLYEKLGVENRAEAVNLGWSQGLLRPPS